MIWVICTEARAQMCKKALFLVVGEVLSGLWPESFVLSYSFLFGNDPSLFVQKVKLNYWFSVSTVVDKGGRAAKKPHP